MTTELVELADRIESRANEYFGRTGASDEWRMGFVKDAQAIRALASRAGVPDGFVLVPDNATKRMEEAGLQWLTHLQHMRKQDRHNAIANAYASMLAAAPEPVAVGSNNSTNDEER